MSGDRAYRVEFTEAARRGIDRLPLASQTRLIRPTLGLGDEPIPAGARKVVGTAYWRIRAGDLRVIYSVDDSLRLVVITRIARRNEATYRRIRETPAELEGG